MDLFLEMTRQCNLKCSHCLRGTAQAKTMSENTLWHALRTLGHWGYIGIGGGEPLMSDKIIRKLRNAVLQTDAYKTLDILYLVTNGKRAVENSSIREVLADFPADTVQLHVSTDQWHDEDAEYNHKWLENHFEYSSKIDVRSHGPRFEYNIVDMGRSGRGKECEYYANESMLYVDVDGYVWGSCDLSYSFMRRYRDRAICYGNVITNTEEEIIKNRDNLSLYLEIEDICMPYSENNGGLTRTVVENKINELKEAI